MNKQRIRMNRVQRAKQFAPFSALKGLEEALAEKEREYEPQAELSDDAAEELDRCLRGLQKGTAVTIKYYRDGGYELITGIFRGINCGGELILDAGEFSLSRISAVTANREN